MIEQQQQRLALALFSNPKNGGKLRSVARLESLCGFLKAYCPVLEKCYKIYYANKMLIAYFLGSFADSFIVYVSV